MRLWPLPLILLLAACDSEEAPPFVNNAQPEATAPIVTRGDDAEEPLVTPQSPPVPRETADHRPESPPPPIAPRSKIDQYRAIGTEPFWSVTITGSTALLDRPDRSPLRYDVTRNSNDRAVRYLGDGFAMTLTPGPCSDGMSDSIWSDQVAVAFGEGTLKGCGGARDDDGDPAL